LKQISRIKISRTLKFNDYYSSDGKFKGGGIGNKATHIHSELWLEIMEDLFLNEETNEEESTGVKQVHLGGTRQGLEELAVILLALSQYDPPEPGYSASFELPNEEGKPIVNLVLHLPVNSMEEKQPFPMIHHIARAIFDEKSGEIDTSINYKSKKQTEK
jgi:hypothetical protein